MFFCKRKTRKDQKKKGAKKNKKNKIRASQNSASAGLGCLLTNISKPAYAGLDIFANSQRPPVSVHKKFFGIDWEESKCVTVASAVLPMTTVTQFVTCYIEKTSVFHCFPNGKCDSYTF